MSEIVKGKFVEVAKKHFASHYRGSNINEVNYKGHLFIKIKRKGERKDDDLELTYYLMCEKDDKDKEIYCLINKDNVNEKIFIHPTYLENQYVIVYKNMPNINVMQQLKKTENEQLGDFSTREVVSRIDFYRHDADDSIKSMVRNRDGKYIFIDNEGNQILDKKELSDLLNVFINNSFVKSNGNYEFKRGLLRDYCFAVVQLIKEIENIEIEDDKFFILPQLEAVEMQNTNFPNLVGNQFFKDKFLMLHAEGHAVLLYNYNIFDSSRIYYDNRDKVFPKGKNLISLLNSDNYTKLQREGTPLCAWWSCCCFLECSQCRSEYDMLRQFGNCEMQLKIIGRMCDLFDRTLGKEVAVTSEDPQNGNYEELNLSCGKKLFLLKKDKSHPFDSCCVDNNAIKNIVYIYKMSKKFDKFLEDNNLFSNEINYKEDSEKIINWMLEKNCLYLSFRCLFSSRLMTNEKIEKILSDFTDCVITKYSEDRMQVDKICKYISSQKHIRDSLKKHLENIKQSNAVSNVKKYFANAFLSGIYDNKIMKIPMM